MIRMKGEGNMTPYINKFHSHVKEILDKIVATQGENISKAVELMKQTYLEGHNLFAFGPGHAGMFAEEMFYRAGGLVIANPIFSAGVNCEARPITMTTAFEQMPGYGKVVLENSPVKMGDCLIIHSVAGRNPIVIEMAQKAREKGIRVIGVVNMDYASRVTSKDPSGKMLQEVCEVVIDTCGDYGDAFLEIAGLEQKVGPTSSIIGSFIANLLSIEMMVALLEEGEMPPVFQSANVDGGGIYNQNLMEKYKERIFYL